MSASGPPSWTGALRRLPFSARLTLTAFLAIIGAGYLVAVANIYERHALADGRPGLSLGDLRAVYRGGSGDAGASRMLTMIRTEMRQYIDSESDFAVLEGWLAAGGKRDVFEAGERRKTPERILIRHCLRCHAESTGTEIAKRSPFGPDELTVDYAKIEPLVGAGRPGPQYTLSRLVLVSHQHMLSIPVFTLIVAGLFMLTRVPARLRLVLTPIPMAAAAADFLGWWLARVTGAGPYIIAGAGLLFGVAFGVQLLCIAGDLWLGRRPLRRGAFDL